MIAKNRNIGYMLLFISIVFLVAKEIGRRNIAAVPGTMAVPMILLIVYTVTFLLFVITFIAGCIQLCKARGYPWQMGLLGLLTIIGLIIIILLPDKNKIATKVL